MTENKIRTLEEICDVEDFSITVLGHTYCSLNFTRKIGCQYQGVYCDNNEIRPCFNPRYNKLAYDMKPQ